MADDINSENSCDEDYINLEVNNRELGGYFDNSNHKVYAFKHIPNIFVDILKNANHLEEITTEVKLDALIDSYFKYRKKFIKTDISKLFKIEGAFPTVQDFEKVTIF